MLATILRTEVAAEVSIKIMRTFVTMRKYISKSYVNNVDSSNMLINLE